VFSPAITHITPVPVKVSKPDDSGAMDAQNGAGRTADERQELEREVSLYRKISTYFSRESSSLAPR
jgi:hypothetical protein